MGNSLSFFRNYLSDHSQFVVFDSFSSEKILVAVEVPQGSILGPLLFLLYINDLTLITDDCTAIMFANDSTFHSAAKNITALEPIPNKELSKISMWCDENHMCLIPEK